MSEEKWEIQELVDDASAMGEHHPAMINEYVWQMNLHGRIVHDLTAASFDQIAIQPCRFICQFKNCTFWIRGDALEISIMIHALKTFVKVLYKINSKLRPSIFAEK